MSLLDIVRSGVAIANSVTAPLQASVTHYAYASATGSGTRTYAAPVVRKALVEMKQQQVRTSSGELTMSRASVVFLDPAVIVTLFDKIVLPGGITGPILAMDGFLDAITGTPILTEVFLG
jgi:hypothetical protein